ncbi:MAG: site-specific integrase [Candidatus Thermoplasmatota archaeon]|nr:site-specific integrase [Candidatus Thermoplasmatota archaeon]
MKNDKIEEFLDKEMIDAPNTRDGYRCNIQSYFKILDKDMNTYFKEIPEDKKEREKVLQEYDNDLRRAYVIQQKEHGRPELSMRTFFNSIKQFMVSNDKMFKDLDFWDTLKARTKGAEPKSDEAILNATDIKTILSHGNACSRALFLMLASSGRRISEILALTPNDVHVDEIPSWVNIKKGLTRDSTKTRQKTYQCFISNETADAYKAWMKERDYYLKVSSKKHYFNNNNINDLRVFPMSYHNALAIWKNLLMRAKLVEIEHFKAKKTGKMLRRPKKEKKIDRILMHPHSLRKFYRSYLGDADLAEYLMGHSTVLTKAYRQMKPEDLAKKYLGVMPNVTIFEVPPNLENINQEILNLKQQLDNKDKQINDMNSKLLMLLAERELKK